jgi:hypothetical protein
MIKWKNFGLQYVTVPTMNISSWRESGKRTVFSREQDIERRVLLYADHEMGYQQ